MIIQGRRQPSIEFVVLAADVAPVLRGAANQSRVTIVARPTKALGAQRVHNSKRMDDAAFVAINGLLKAATEHHVDQRELLGG
jgi:hypothetical protein